MSEPLVVDASVTLPGHVLEWTAVRGSGPGGQNVNKVASKVQLACDFEATTALPDAAKARLRVLARNQLDSLGRILIVSQKTRDQLQNLADARAKLRALLVLALKVPVRRWATKPTRSSKVRRLVEKKRTGDKKAGRKRPDRE